MKFWEAVCWLIVLALLWARTAVWLDAATGFNFGFAFIGGGILAGSVTAGLHHLVSKLVDREW